MSVNGVGSFDTHNSFKESAFSTAADGGSSDTHNALSEHDSFKESASSNAADDAVIAFEVSTDVVGPSETSAASSSVISFTVSI